jgi:hypothetical protein
METVGPFFTAHAPGKTRGHSTDVVAGIQFATIWANGVGCSYRAHKKGGRRDPGAALRLAPRLPWGCRFAARSGELELQWEMSGARVPTTPRIEMAPAREGACVHEPVHRKRTCSIENSPRENEGRRGFSWEIEGSGNEMLC